MPLAPIRDIASLSSREIGANLALKNDSLDRDYIDLVEVILFVWKARLFILLGAILGIALGWIAAEIKAPKLFITSLPLVWGGEIPTIADSYIANFNRVVTDPGVAGEVFTALEADTDPRIKPLLDSVGLDRQTFLRLQSGKQGGNFIPLRLMRDGPLVLETRFTKSRDVNAELSMAFARAIQSVMDARWEKIGGKSPPLVKDPGQKKSEMSRYIARYEDVARLRAAELDPIKIQMYAIESRLAQKLKSPLNKIVRNDENVLWLLGALLNSGGISAPEAEEVAGKYALLAAKLAVASARHQLLFKDANDVMSQVLSRTDQSLSLELLPMIKVDVPAMQAQLKSGALERSESRIWVFTLVGAALGGLAALICYAFSGFVLQTRDRIRLLAKR